MYTKRNCQVENDVDIFGVIPPMITPFTEAGKIYEGGLDNIIEFLLTNGVHGLFCIGSYGSFALMDIAERKQVAAMILSKINGRVPVFIQVGSPSTNVAVELARHAEGTGATFVASVIPFYYSGFAYKEDNIVRHFESLCKAVNIPVYLYNNPKTTYYHASLNLLKKLVEVGVRGMKDSSGDYMYMVEVIREIGQKFNVMAGTAGLLQPLYYQGSKACVAGTSNAFPEILVSLYESLEAGDVKKASRLQNLVIGLRKIQAVRGFRPATCYTLLRMRGIDAGTARAPWIEPEKELVEQMRKALLQIEEVKDFFTA